MQKIRELVEENQALKHKNMDTEMVSNGWLNLLNQTKSDLIDLSHKVIENDTDAAK